MSEKEEVKEIPIDKIRTPEGRKRDLADLHSMELSIKRRIEDGKRSLLQPIIVKRLENDTYELQIGYRRLTACKNIGLETIPCIFEETTPMEQLKENLLRKEYLPYEEGSLFKVAIVKGISTKDLALELANGSIDYVKNRLQISNLPSDIGLSIPRLSTLKGKTQDELKRTITSEKGRALLRIRDEKEQRKLADMITDKGLTTKELGKMITNANKMFASLDILEATHPELAEDLREFWLPLRYEKGSFEDMEEEISIRSGNPPRITQYLPVEDYPEEKIEEYAREKHGEVVEKVEYWRVYIVPRSPEEIRNKWSEE